MSGCAPTNPDGSTAGGPDAYQQARACLGVVFEALTAAGAGVEDVVRTRIYITDAALAGEVGRAHGELFGAHPPATSMVVVAALINPEWLVEIEADAVLPG